MSERKPNKKPRVLWILMFHGYQGWLPSMDHFCAWQTKKAALRKKKKDRKSRGKGKDIQTVQIRGEPMNKPAEPSPEVAPMQRNHDGHLRDSAGACQLCGADAKEVFGTLCGYPKFMSDTHRRKTGELPAVAPRETQTDALAEVLDMFPPTEILREITPDDEMAVRVCPMNKTPRVADVLRWRAALERGR